MKCPCTNLPLMFALVGIIIIIAYMQYYKRNTTKTAKHMLPTRFFFYGVTYPYTLPPLKYAYNALEPHIDAETMQIHHTKHHQAYVDNLNKALQDYPELHKNTIEELLTNLDALPSPIRDRVRNNGGGHFSHMLFWDSITPHDGGKITPLLEAEINKSFVSFALFKEQFEKAAQGHVGSGWTWLCLTPAKKLSIIVTLNHDTPMAQGLYPILVLDIWEHAYYLKYRNKRADYIATWWNIINWNHVEELYNNGLKSIS
jgi:superoxide dismutase, Fe-Mn family